MQSFRFHSRPTGSESTYQQVSQVIHTCPKVQEVLVQKKADALTNVFTLLFKPSLYLCLLILLVGSSQISTPLSSVPQRESFKSVIINDLCDSESLEDLILNLHT